MNPRSQAPPAPPGNAVQGGSAALPGLCKIELILRKSRWLILSIFVPLWFLFKEERDGYGANATVLVTGQEVTAFLSEES